MNERYADKHGKRNIVAALKVGCDATLLTILAASYIHKRVMRILYSIAGRESIHT